MSTVSEIILVGSNLVLAAAVAFHVLKSAPTSGHASMADSSHTDDLQVFLEPVCRLDESVNRLNLTLQRFNTTALQYQYLEKEIERLGQLDQTLAKRINLEETKTPKAETEDAESGLKQLQLLQGQVRQELKRNRESMVRIIEGLERQLDSAALAKKAVVNAPGNGDAPKTGKSMQSSAPANPPAADTSPQ